MKQTGMAAAGLLAARLSANAFAGPADDERFRQLKEAISAHASQLKIPGLAAAVVENGQASFVHTEGYADIEKKIPVRRDHIFPVASLTKTFAAVNLALYEQQGKISLDDYILDYPFLPVGFTPDRLYTPNLKIKHVLSHTSEGDPGSNFMYNGNRYSFVYGVFEKISGNTKHYDAFADEVTKNILRPLNMSSTLPGYPADKTNPAIPRIVTTYHWDREHKTSSPDTGLPGATILYPANGMLTSIDDLAAYCNALDENTLLTADSYQKLTTPFVTVSGRKNPYGMGWSTQLVAGKQVHWHYGYGDTYAALIIRAPQDKRSFILLTNNVAASEPFFLGYGNVLNSFFAQTFFKHVVFPNGRYDSSHDEQFSRVMISHWAGQNEEAAALMQTLAQQDPGRFKKMDVSLIHILSELSIPALKTQMESAISAYAASGWFHPDIHEKIAAYYAKNNNWPAAYEWYHQLADSKGYGEQWGVKNACTVLGKYYLEHGEKEKGRRYLWREALYSPGDAADQIILMNPK